MQGEKRGGGGRGERAGAAQQVTRGWEGRGSCAGEVEEEGVSDMEPGRGKVGWTDLDTGDQEREIREGG